MPAYFIPVLSIVPGNYRYLMLKNDDDSFPYPNTLENADITDPNLPYSFHIDVLPAVVGEENSRIVLKLTCTSKLTDEFESRISIDGAISFSLVDSAGTSFLSYENLAVNYVND